MMNITNTIQNLIQQALTELGFTVEQSEITLEHPADLKFGDYSSNVAMVNYNRWVQQLSNKKMQWLDRNKTNSDQYNGPRALAQAIADKIQAQLAKDKKTMIAEVSVAGPGFINFKLSDSFFLAAMQQLIKQKADLIPLLNKNKRVMVEFTDPNPFKEFHIGHLYSNIVGESLARLFEITGAKVKRVCYQGDVGMHVAKSVWGMLKKMDQAKLELQDLEKWPLNKRVNFLGQSYALGANEYKGDEKTQERIKNLNYLIYICGQENLEELNNWQAQVDYKQYLKESGFDYQEVKRVYQVGRAWSLEYFESIYQRLGTKFDDYFFESLVGELGIKVVRENIKNKIFQKSKGAIIFPGEKYALHNRVFINSLGLPTYEAKELGLAIEKNKRWPYDLSIPVTGNEIDEYFKVLLTALRQVKPELAKKTVHISHGMVRLPEGKMSSRTGKVLTGEWMLDKAKDLVKKILDETRTEVPSAEKEDVAEKVGQAAIKFALLSTDLGRNIAFAFDTSLKFSGFSGPYLQYTYARCQSVLRNAKLKSETKLASKFSDIKQEEKALLRVIYQFPEVVLKAASNFIPHHLATYLFELAQSYSSFYSKHQIIKATTQEQKLFRLQLTQATALILKKGLGLLGIQVVERM
ncbi:MAG: arginine--tRNA ligase [Candidatus Woesebacteria bacterium]|jgi:arginyl-tRNA synthetase